MSDSDLSPLEQLAVRKEVEGVLFKIAALFGIVNFAVAGAAIWAMWSTVTSTADATLSREIRDVRDEFDDALKDAREILGRLKTRSEDLALVEKDIRQLEKHMANVVSSTAIPQMSELLTEIQNTPEMASTLAQVPALVSRRDVDDALVDTVHGCAETKLFTGQTPTANTDWQRYKDWKNGIFTEVDIPAGQFSNTPVVFTSLGGNGGHWSVAGPTSIYSPTSDSFSVYIRWSNESEKSDLLPYAQERNWYLNWLAVGC